MGWYHMTDMHGNDTRLLAVQQQDGCSLGEHFSGNNTAAPGWAFASTFCYGGASHTGWPDGRIFAFQLKENPKVLNVAHHRSAYANNYRTAPFANINTRGTRIYFGSNWGTGLTTDMDVYKVDLPEYWWTVLYGSPDNESPTADISANPTNGLAPLNVAFTGSGTDSDGNVVSYAWSFGDGAVSTVQNPTHTYNNAGHYTATLTVTDNKGGIGIDSISIVVTDEGGSANDPPDVDVTANLSSGNSPLAVDFAGSATDSDGSVISYHWNFGDGTTSSSQQNPSHLYIAPGNYSAELDCY